jgi:acyl carrier protein
MDLETRVKEIIADQLGVEIEKLRDDANFVAGPWSRLSGCGGACNGL